MAYRKNNYFRKFVWWVIYILIIFFGIMYCSPKARNTTLEFIGKKIDNSIKNNDSIKVIAPTKKDSIKVVEKVIDNKISGDTIKLVKGDDKLYKLPVNINGVMMQFSLDTGCSDMSLSFLEYEFMRRHGYIEDSDIINHENVTIANGDTVKTMIVNLKNISIGNHTVENVKCSVFMNTDAPTLLGQDVLSKIGNVLISYNKNCLIIQN